MVNTDIVTTDNLGDKIFEAAKTSFGAKFGSVKQFVQAESEKLAITLRMIIEASATGDISKAEAKFCSTNKNLLHRRFLQRPKE